MSENNSKRIECGFLPSIITTPLTPSSTAFIEVFTFGIIPSLMVSSSINFSASVGLISEISFSLSSKTPSISVYNINLLDFILLAIAPAAVSAFILY